MAARRGSVPALDSSQALIVLILNLIVPGTGTLFGAIVGHHPMLGRALAQFLLAILVIGWVWALRTSLQCLRNVRKVPGPTPAVAPTSHGQISEPPSDPQRADA